MPDIPGTPTILLFLHSGHTLPIDYKSVDLAADAMQHFMHIMARAPRYRRGCYTGTDIRMTLDGTREVVTFLVEHRDIAAARFVLMQRDRVPVPNE